MRRLKLAQILLFVSSFVFVQYVPAEVVAVRTDAELGRAIASAKPGSETVIELTGRPTVGSIAVAGGPTWKFVGLKVRPDAGRTGIQIASDRAEVRDCAFDFGSLTTRQ